MLDSDLPAARTGHATAGFWFDPICPWAWLTSRWMLEVEQVRPVTVEWHVMSLAILNEPKEIDPDYRSWLSGTRFPGRVLVAAAAQHGQDVLLPLYTALGNRIHVDGRGPEAREVGWEQLVREALDEAGLPAELLEAGRTEGYDEVLVKSHRQGMEPVGDDVGTPVIHVPGPDGGTVAFFGPVVTPAPRGEAAGRLWDGTLLVAGTPGFFELKRTRTSSPTFE